MRTGVDRRFDAPAKPAFRSNLIISGLPSIRLPWPGTVWLLFDSSGSRSEPAVEKTDAAARVLSDAGFVVSTATIDVSSRTSDHALVQRATALGDVTSIIRAAAVSATQASPATILAIDLCCTTLVF
jgi:hypothetical protein